MRRIACFVTLGIITILLVSCATSVPSLIPTPTTAAPIATTAAPPTTTKPAATTAAVQAPKYGGTLVMSIAADVTNWDPERVITSNILDLTNQHLWAGDWTKGPAGGYGTNQTDWAFGDNDIWALNTGFIAESWKWTVDAQNKQGTIVYQIRQGIRYAVNPNSEASKLVNGREITTDDVLWNFKRAVTSKTSYLYGRNVELRPAEITKTGPQEITVKVPLASLASAISRFGVAVYIVPPEVVAKYGDMQDWKNSVGSGPFMLTNYVAGSAATMVKNPNFWMKDPIGPGKGNQLPYMDGVNVLVLSDHSTAVTAFRTGKIDWIGGGTALTQSDAAQLESTIPTLQGISGTSWQGRGTPAYMRTDTKPFSDVRVRRALMMSIDFQTILKNLYGGKGQIVTFPFSYVKDYAGAYLGLDDPTFPASAKQLYTYHPDEAKKLLADAGYASGFTTELLIQASEADYWTIIQGYFAKIGVNMTFNIQDPGVKTSIQNSNSHKAMTTYTTGPVATYFQGGKISGDLTNLSEVHDPVIDKAMAEVALAAITDETKAEQLYRNLLRDYVYD